jgi:hypothetical protein
LKEALRAALRLQECASDEAESRADLVALVRDPKQALAYINFAWHHGIVVA